MNNLINEMAQVLEFTLVDMMERTIELQEEYGEVTPELVAKSLLRTAFTWGANSEQHQKCAELYNEYKRIECAA